MTYGVEKAVATITLDHPENRNALTPELLADLGGGLERAVGDTEVRVIVITNTGPAFCAGADLKAGRVPTGSTYGLPDVLALIQDSPKPVVARIAGHCLAGGVGIAAAADLSIAVDDARFGFTEVRLGLAPAIISVPVLAKLRRVDASELFLTGERISAARAAEVGLITRAVPAAELDQAVAVVIGQLLAGGPSALAASKQLVSQVPGMAHGDAYTWTAQLSAEMFAADEGRAGLAAYWDKRPAPWVPQ